jgi:serine/threonine-protein kinase
MEKYDAHLHVCPHCGYDEATPANPAYITPGTLLHDRYLVGILLEYNGEGATYAGYDVSTDCKVLLREYMPINLCTRVKNKATISVNYNDLAKYKAFMAEYTELNKSLARLRNDSNIKPVLDMFAENNTTYTVFEHIDGVKILDFLKENAGELSWEQVSKIFPPLFTTIGRLHNAGIIHRAISPDTVYITKKGELRLSSFCISAVEQPMPVLNTSFSRAMQLRNSTPQAAAAVRVHGLMYTVSAHFSIVLLPAVCLMIPSTAQSMMIFTSRICLILRFLSTFQELS